MTRCGADPKALRFAMSVSPTITVHLVLRTCSGVVPVPFRRRLLVFTGTVPGLLHFAGVPTVETMETAQMGCLAMVRTQRMWGYATLLILGRHLCGPLFRSMCV